MKKYLKRNKFYFMICVLLFSTAGIMSVFLASIVQKMVDTSVDKNIIQFYHVMILAVLFIIINFLIYVLRGFFRAKYLKNVMFSLNHDLFKGIFFKTVKEFNQENSSAYLSIFNNDLKIIERNYFDNLLTISADLSQFIICLVAVFSFQFSLAIIVIVINVIAIFAPVLFGKVLSKKQIESITADNDIQVKISGSNQVFTIDILKGENISSKTLAMNDDEDSFVGKTEVLEYSIDNGKTWKAFDRDTRITGNQTVLARYRAHGVYLSGDSTEYNFTENNDKEKKYVYVKDISYISSGSSQSGYAAKNMIDASPFTTWHTTWGQVAKDKTYVVSFNEVKYLSQITYDPADGVNGRIKSAKVYVSLDGKEWTLAGEKTNMANNTARKELVLDESLPAKFVKIEATETYGNHEGPNKYVSGRRFNYYEDTTKIYKDPSIEYSVTSLTNKDVVATLQLPSGFKAVGESTYTFDKNGEHTFTYKDLNNKEKTIKAKVSWIDKEVPTATVEYDITEKTEFAVKATLKDFSKENVKVLNGDENGSHTFTKNGEFTFMIQDEAGNIGYVTAKVTWITAKDTEVDDDLYVKSDDYVVKDDVIKNIDANTSLEELKSKLNTNAKQFKLIKNGQEVDIISTGTILVLDNDRSYTLVVTGDINGDSYHNELDLTLLINHLLDRTLIQNEIESMASDMNDDGEIDIVDLSIMNKKTLN